MGSGRTIIPPVGGGFGSPELRATVSALAEAEALAAPVAVAAAMVSETVGVETMPEPDFVRVRDIQPLLAWAILAGMGLACALATALALLAGR